MTVTAASFRVDFTEFASTTIYPDSEVNFWLGVAVKLLDPLRWSTMLDPGIELFTAHWLVIERMNRKEATNGNIPGTARGMLTGGGVDKVNFSYDTSSVSELDAGHWNLSNYGMRFIHFARMFGAGPIQVASEPVPSVSAWQGVIYWP